MIFPVLELENIVQVNDKTRLKANKSYSPDGTAITLIEIEPEAAAGFIDVTSSQYLDYQYATDGTKTVTLRINGSDTATKTIDVLSQAGDRLFSSDAELVPHEPDIMNYVRAGRNSFLDVHRTAQDRILTWLDEHRIWDINGDKLTKEQIINLEEVNDWSKFLTLRLIFEGLSNAVEDIFFEKANRYKKMEEAARNRAAFRLDANSDGQEDANKLDFRSFRIYRA